MIRPARRADDPALAAIDRLTWSVAVGPAPRPAADRPFFGAAPAPEDVLVAEQDGVVAGYVALGPVLPLAAAAHVLHVTGLAVHPGHQGRGVGRRLVEAAVAEATARGARRLTLRVLGPNTTARALYASCGFEEEGVMRELFLLDGRYVDDVLMARPLVV